MDRPPAAPEAGLQVSGHGEVLATSSAGGLRTKRDNGAVTVAPIDSSPMSVAYLDKLNAEPRRAVEHGVGRRGSPGPGGNRCSCVETLSDWSRFRNQVTRWTSALCPRQLSHFSPPCRSCHRSSAA